MRRTLRRFIWVLAESEGFEPPSPCELTVFKTAAFDRSANSPAKDFTCAGPRHGPVNCRWHERANQRQDASREDLWPAGLGRGGSVKRVAGSGRRRHGDRVRAPLPRQRLGSPLCQLKLSLQFFIAARILAARTPGP